MNDAIPVADEDSVRGAQVRIALWGQVKGSDAQPGGGYPRPPPTYLLSVELHEAHQVAIFLESNKEVHHRGEGKDGKHCGEGMGGRPGCGRGLSLCQGPKSRQGLCMQLLPVPTPQVT